MESIERQVSHFQAQVEGLPVDGWREILSRSRKAARERQAADEFVSEQLAEASMAIARKKRAPEVREAERAAIWRANDRNTAIAAAIAKQMPARESTAAGKAVASLLRQVTATIRAAARLKKTADGKAAMATMLAPFDGFVELPR